MMIGIRVKVRVRVSWVSSYKNQIIEEIEGMCIVYTLMDISFIHWILCVSL